MLSQRFQEEGLFMKPYDPKYVNDEVNKMKNSGIGSQEMLNDCLIKVCSQDEEYSMVAEKLIEAGADVNCRDSSLNVSLRGSFNALLTFCSHNKTPLILCSMNGHESLLKVLIDEGATVDEHNEDGNTALHASVLHNKFFCVKVLLSAGNANDMICNYTGHLPSEFSTFKYLTDLFQKRDLKMLVEKKSKLGRKEVNLEMEIRNGRDQIEMHKIHIEGLKGKILRLQDERKKTLEMKKIFEDRILEVSLAIGPPCQKESSIARERLKGR